MAAAPFRWWSRRRRSLDDPEPPTAAAPNSRPVAAPIPVVAQRSSPAVAERDTAVGDGVRNYIRVQVRSGVHDVAELRRLAIDAAETEISPPATADEVARVMLSEELTQWHTDAASWSGRTDPERLDRALCTLREHGVLVLPALDDADVLYEVTRIQGCPNGAVAYLAADVVHALNFGELPLRVLDGEGRPAHRSDPIVVEVMNTLAEEGLLGMGSKHADSPVSVVLEWRRRPSS